jgi:hypothetical protein
MFMLAGLAKPRLPGNTNELPFFRQMKFSSRIMFMLAGLANRRQPGNTKFVAVFRQMQFSSRLMFMLAGLANRRLPGNPKKYAVFRKMHFSFMSMLAGVIKHRDCLTPGKTIFRVLFRPVLSTIGCRKFDKWWFICH